MARRSFGTKISGNRRKSHELSNIVRGLILNDLDEGKSQKCNCSEVSGLAGCRSINNLKNNILSIPCLVKGGWLFFRLEPANTSFD